MDQTLALNARTQDLEQTVNINVVLPLYATIGVPHANIRLHANILRNGNVSIELVIRDEDSHQIYSQRFVYRPDELIPAYRHRRKEQPA